MATIEMTYEEKLEFFRNGFRDVPLQDFANDDEYQLFSVLARTLCYAAGFDMKDVQTNDEWLFAALAILCERSPKARTHFKRDAEDLS